MKICFASHNANKVKELNTMVPKDVQIIGLEDLGVFKEIAETGTTLEENSSLKAQFIHKNQGVPVIADDSGLIVHALNGEPGVYSARYAGPEKNDENNMDLLLKNLAGQKDRSAEFQTVITYINHDGNEFQFKGVVAGSIIEEKRGTKGFGYDPLFVPDDYHKTFAELDPSEKNRISHRAIAVQKFLTFLKKSNG